MHVNSAKRLFSSKKVNLARPRTLLSNDLVKPIRRSYTPPNKGERLGMNFYWQLYFAMKAKSSSLFNKFFNATLADWKVDALSLNTI